LIELLHQESINLIKNLIVPKSVRNALQVASYRGCKQVFKTLLDKGADVNAQGE